ncbi:MAG: type IV pilus assembly protein PilM [Planctomycetota bacterium]|nr:MAG: type IV pilus assembly protein PilM [Planctomycetota bacterium]
MASNRTVWGIDLGQCALKAICLRAAEDKVEAINHVYIEHAQILSKPDVNRHKLIEEAMDKLLKEHDLSNEILVVGVPGQHTLARFTKLPPVDKKKIPEIVKYEAQQQIPFDMEEVIWDYQAFQDPEATETEVGIFAMRRELLREHLQFLTRHNLEPAVVQSSPLALYNALKFDGLCGKEGLAVLDIGTQNTDLIVIDGDSLWTRNIPIGGNNFTEALLKTFKLSFNKAENLKRSAASHKYARQIFQAMRPTFADLVAEIQRSIGFFTSSRRGIKLSKLIAMGNAFRLPGMQKYIQQNLGMEVVRPTTFSQLSASEAPNAPQLIDQLLSFGVAYGLALQGLGLASITSNLLPTEIAKQVIWRKQIPWFYGAAACLALSASLVWGRYLTDQSALSAASNGTRQSVSQEISAAQQILANGPAPDLSPKNYAQTILDACRTLQSKLDNEMSRNQTQIQELEQIKNLHKNKSIWPKILHLIHTSLPPLDPKLKEAMDIGPESYKELVQSDKKYQRGKRKIIFIDKIDAAYAPDVAASYEEIKGQLAGLGSGSSRIRSQTVDESQLLPGFIITITGQTPYEDNCKFLNDTFVRNLNEASIEGVYFESADMPRCYLLNSADQGSTIIGSGRTGRHSTPRIGRHARGSGEFGAFSRTETVDSDKDVITGEPLVNDYEFVIVLKAILGDKPKTNDQQDTPGESEQ